VVSEPSGKAFALAYLRCRSKGVQILLEGKRVQVNCVDSMTIWYVFKDIILSCRGLQGQTAASVVFRADKRYSSAISSLA